MYSTQIFGSDVLSRISVIYITYLVLYLKLPLFKSSPPKNHPIGIKHIGVDEIVDVK